MLLKNRSRGRHRDRKRLRLKARHRHSHRDRDRDRNRNRKRLRLKASHRHRHGSRLRLRYWLLNRARDRLRSWGTLRVLVRLTPGLMPVLRPGEGKALLVWRQRICLPVIAVRWG